MPPAEEVLETVTTADGRRVQLLSNGTWRYEPAPAAARARPASIPDNLKLLRESGPNFRLARWGMSSLEVRNSERSSLISREDALLAYQDAYLGKPCRVEYLFALDQLVSGRYLFEVDQAAPNQLIPDYVALKDELRKKFGEPKARKHGASDQIWVNTAYRPDPENWGRAVSLGHLMLLASWQLEQSRINLILKGENYDARLLIEFQSNDHAASSGETPVPKTMS